MMFWRKKEPTSPGPAMPIVSSDKSASPRPILKTPGDVAGGPSIRFAAGMGINAANSSVPLWNPSASASPSAPLPPPPSQAAPAPAPTPSPRGAAGHVTYPMKAPAARAPLELQISVAAASQAGPSRAGAPAPYGGADYSGGGRGGGYGGPITRPVPPPISVAPAKPNPVVTRAVGGRKSSRPISPTASSFGAKIRNGQGSSSSCSSSSSSSSSASSGALGEIGVNGLHDQSRPTTPLATPPMLASAHITTPPTAYVSALQSRQPPPPSPYRPTTVSDRRPIPSLESLPGDIAPRPPRGSSLFETPTAPGRSTAGAGPASAMAGMYGHGHGGLAGTSVPMVNIIPATPQEGTEEFNALPVAGTWRKRRASQTSLEESAVIHKPVAIRAPGVGGGGAELPDTDLASISLSDESEDDHDHTTPTGPSSHSFSLPQIPHVSSLPNIDLALDFSPFNPSADLPTTDAPTDPLPPSPPFQSYSSLPSLESHHSMPSSASEDTMLTSTSNSSLMSFPDVEEALGSMLASLSDGGPLPIVPDAELELQSTPKPTSQHIPPGRLPHGNPGLGLGLDLPSSGSITAPLSVSPKRRPPPLDLSAARKNAAPTQTTAPPVINHRVAFYKTAKAHPNSPASGTFQHPTPQSATATTYAHSYQGSISSISSGESSASSSSSGSSGSGRSGKGPKWRDSTATIPEGLPYDHQSRDSISLASESSDDDLHTASIISLMPMIGERGVMQVAQEEILGEEVGLAF